jgi:hypothetical protein
MVMLLLATDSDDVGRRLGAVQRFGPRKMVGARLADPWANLSGSCGLGLRCRREEAQLPSIFAQQAMQVPFVHDDHVIQQLPASAADSSRGNTMAKVHEALLSAVST